MQRRDNFVKILNILDVPGNELVEVLWIDDNEIELIPMQEFISFSNTMP